MLTQATANFEDYTNLLNMYIASYISKAFSSVQGAMVLVKAAASKSCRLKQLQLHSCVLYANKGQQRHSRPADKSKA